MYYNNFDPLMTATKVVAGQAIDSASPTAGLMYHVAATATARSNADLLLGILGIIGSASKMGQQDTEQN